MKGYERVRKIGKYGEVGQEVEPRLSGSLFRDQTLIHARTARYVCTQLVVKTVHNVNSGQLMLPHI